MPYLNEHACKLNEEKTVARTNCARKSGGKCLDVLYYRKPNGKLAEHSYRYPKEVWSASSARAHCNSHNGSFEAASGGNNAHIDNPLLQDASNRNHEYSACQSCQCKEENE